MKTLLIFALSALLSTCAVADTPRAVSELSPAELIEASKALRAFKFDTHDTRTARLHAAARLIELTEEQILKRWSILHDKDEVSRDAVLRNIEQLQQRVHSFVRQLAAQLDSSEHDALRTLQAKFDASADDLRLLLRTAFR